MIKALHVDCASHRRNLFDTFSHLEMKFIIFTVFLHTVLIVTVAAENVAPIKTFLGQNTKRIEPRLIHRLTDGNVSAVDACQEDYTPCICQTYSWDPSLFVYCNDVTSFASVQAVFRRSTARQVKEFVLTIPTFEENKTIPADLLSGKAAQQITLICPSTETQLIVDPKAFNFSEDYTIFIEFSKCNLNQLNYTFLTNFNVLKEISYSNLNNFSQWSGLPILPGLRKLSVVSSSDFKDFKNLPVSQLPALSEYSIRLCPNFQLLPNTTTMTILRIESCPLFKQWQILTQQKKMTSLALLSLDSIAINDALDSITSSLSVDTLIDLTLTRNALKQVPAQVQLLSQLQAITLSLNNITFVGNGTLSFRTPNLQYLDLSENGLDTIESDAFQGNFGNCQINLSYNRLSRLESSVFKPIVEQMELTARYGFIEVYENPIECDCHLEWLFVDTKNPLYYVHNGKCSNGTSFSWLTPGDFSSCKLGSTIPTNKPPTTPATGGASSSHQILSYINLIILLLTVIIISS